MQNKVFLVIDKKLQRVKIDALKGIDTIMIVPVNRSGGIKMLLLHIHGFILDYSESVVKFRLQDKAKALFLSELDIKIEDEKVNP
ncbi:MAG: hypothetical protein ACM3SY_01445 [Candidatus Omnitrophota bacterium]